VYAAAAREQLRLHDETAVVPAVFIHYIRESKTIPIETIVWEQALNQLEDQIGEITRVNDHDSTA
jgi:hypothetical protein